MQYRELGQAKQRVSALGLGCMGMSEFYGTSDDQQSIKTLERALELGLNFFDTADTYGLGHNESLIGRFIAEGSQARREQMVIATKFGIVRSANSNERRFDNSPEYIQSACEASLKRLGIETIDLYYCHRRNPATPIEELVGAMADLVRQGKVKQIGLSEVSVETLKKAHAVHPIAAVQSEYSLWTRGPESGMLQACVELGTTFVPYSPLGRAFLTGSVSAGNLADNDFRKNNPRFAGEHADSNRERVEALTAFAQSRNVTNAQVALAWIMNKHANLVPIPGTRRITYLEQNIAALDLSLSHQELEQLDQLFPTDADYGDRYPTGALTGIEK